MESAGSCSGRYVSKEVAQRGGGAGNKVYGVLSVLIQAFMK